MVFRKVNFYSGTYKISIHETKIPMYEILPVLDNISYFNNLNQHEFIDVETLNHTSHIDHQGYVYITATIQFDIDDQKFSELQKFNDKFNGVHFHIRLLHNNNEFPYKLLNCTKGNLIFL